MRRWLLFSIVLASIFAVGSVLAAPDCANFAVAKRLSDSAAVVLARVTDVELAYPEAKEDSPLWKVQSPGLVVVRSWKGPYAPGQRLRASPFCAGLCVFVSVSVGDEIVVFSGPTPQLAMFRCWAFRGDAAVSIAAALDEAAHP